MGHEENPVAPTLVTTGTEDADLRLDRVEQFTRSGTIPTPVQTALDGRYQPLDADLTTLAGGSLPSNLKGVLDLRYDDVVWVMATDMQSVGGSPTRTTVGNTWSLWSLPSGSFTAVGALWTPPAHWATFDAYVWWTNLGAGSGDYTMAGRIGRQTWGDGETLPGATGNDFSSGIAAPAQNVMKRSQVVTAKTATPGELTNVEISRASGSTTPSNAIGILAVELVAASFS